MAPQSIPEAIRTLAEAGGTVAPGAVLAQIVDTTHVAPQIPPHVHINVIDQEGRYYNPLHFFPPLPDALAPVLVGVYVVDPTNQVVAGGNPASIFDEIIAPGAYELVLDIIDQIPPAMHGEAIYKLVVSTNGVLLGKVEFDRLPANNYLTGVSDIYKLEPIRLRDGRLLTNQVDLATPRKFLYRFPFQTEKFSNATTDRVRVAIEAADYAGNTRAATVELKLR